MKSIIPYSKKYKMNRPLINHTIHISINSKKLFDSCSTGHYMSKSIIHLFHLAPICLDPNTAKYNMIVSKDLTSLTTNNEREEVPSNPERCMGHLDVLGSTGINSGMHSWDVQLVGHWEVGVITKTNEETRASLFFIHDSDVVGQHSPENEKYPVVVDNLPKKIRVEFEHDKGKLSFYDLDTKKDIHTITHKFTGLYFPFFRGDVKLIPQCPPLV